MSPPWSTVALVSVVLAACATGGGTRRPPRPGGDTLTSDELATVVGTTQNAYSAVERLRPLFLAVRPGAGTTHDTHARLYVFINGSLAGDIDALKTIPLGSVESIRRVQATTAFTQLGEIHSGDGVILVRLRR
jgi:hypothetical protein